MVKITNNPGYVEYRASPETQSAMGYTYLLQYNYDDEQQQHILVIIIAGREMSMSSGMTRSEFEALIIGDWDQEYLLNAEPKLETYLDRK